MIDTVIINMLLTIITKATKNPKKKKALRELLLQVRDAISALYGEAV